MLKIYRSSVALVDFQYCYGSRETIFIKELAFMGGASVVPVYYLFKPPFDYRELNREIQDKNLFCKTEVHGINWHDGTVDYCSVGDILSPLNEFKFIFVVGEEKKKFLQKYLKTHIIALDMYTGLHNLPSYFTNCPYHRDLHFKCALNNLFKIFVFIEKYDHILSKCIQEQIKV